MGSLSGKLEVNWTKIPGTCLGKQSCFEWVYESIYFSHFVAYRGLKTEKKKKKQIELTLILSSKL